MSPSLSRTGRDLITRAGTGALRGGLDQLVRRNLRGIWVRGVLPTGSAVWASNHHSWWDFFVAAAALRTAGRTDVDVLMQAENIGNRNLFHRAGVIGTDEIRLAVRTLRKGRVVVIFPEGELRAVGDLGATKPGAAWLARSSGATLQLVATRVVLRSHQAPEAYLDIVALDHDLSPEYEAAHREHLQRLDRDLQLAGPSEPPIGFRNVVTGLRNWDERFSTLRAREP